MSFDLNVENYSRDELIEMFDLPPYFDENIIEMKESKLRESIINNREISKDTQQKTLNFLVQAKKIILIGKTDNSGENSTSSIAQTKAGNLSLALSTTPNKLEPIKITDTTAPVQEQKQHPFFFSFPNEHFGGTINPFTRKNVKKNLNIDSRFRDNYYGTSSSNYTINLPLTLKEISTVTLNSIELPTTYFGVSKQYGNNFFTLIVNGNPGVVEIPSGNYTGTTIMQAINNQLSTLTVIDPDFANVVFSINQSLYVNNAFTGSGQTMVGFNGSQSSDSTIELNFQADRFGIDDRSSPLPLKLGWILGFRNGVYVNNLNYVSEGIVDTTGPKYFFLVFNDFNNNVNDGFISAFNSSILNKNILARIAPANMNQLNPFSISQQNNLVTITTPREYFGPVNIQSINIQLLDEYGRILDLNNMDFSFCVTLNMIYDL